MSLWQKNQNVHLKSDGVGVTKGLQALCWWSGKGEASWVSVVWPAHLPLPLYSSKMVWRGSKRSRELGEGVALLVPFSGAAPWLDLQLTISAVWVLTSRDP